MKIGRMWQLMKNGPYVKYRHYHCDRKTKRHTNPGVTKSRLQHESGCVEINKMKEGRKCFIYRRTQHILFYGYMTSDIWLRTILIVRNETRCRHIGYSFRLTARVLLYAPSHRQDNTYHGLCYTSRGALAGTRNSSMGPPHEESIRRPIAT